MSVHSFIVSDPQFPEVKDFSIDVYVLEYQGFTNDFERLEVWCAGIADDFVAGRITRKDLIDDSIRMRIESPKNEIFVDTISQNEE